MSFSLDNFKRMFAVNHEVLVADSNLKQHIAQQLTILWLNILAVFKYLIEQNVIFSEAFYTFAQRNP